MNQYVTGAMIKRLREQKRLTQQMLADKIHVTAKAVSKWETGRGYPDIALVESLAVALDVSLIELFSGADVTNQNKIANLRRASFYVCPVCGNILWSVGRAVISCCGILIPALEAESTDQAHPVIVSKTEDEYHVAISHAMSKTHYISFIAAVKENSCEIAKTYPEGSAEARFKISGTRFLLFFCNRHGLFHISPQDSE